MFSSLQLFIAAQSNVKCDVFGEQTVGGERNVFV
jgi:hypothetical protein